MGQEANVPPDSEIKQEKVEVISEQSNADGNSAQMFQKMEAIHSELQKKNMEEVNDLKAKLLSLESENARLNESIVKSKELKDKIHVEIGKITEKYQRQISSMRRDNEILCQQNQKLQRDFNEIAVKNAPVMVRVEEGELRFGGTENEVLEGLKEKISNLKHQKKELKETIKALASQLEQRDEYWKNHLTEVHGHQSHQQEHKITQLYSELEKMKTHYTNQIEEQNAMMDSMMKKADKVKEANDNLTRMHDEQVKLSEAKEEELSILKESLQYNDAAIEKLQADLIHSATCWTKISNFFELGEDCALGNEEKSLEALLNFNFQLVCVKNVCDTIFAEEIADYSATLIPNEFDGSPEMTPKIDTDDFMKLLKSVLTRCAESVNAKRDLEFERDRLKSSLDETELRLNNLVSTLEHEKAMLEKTLEAKSQEADLLSHKVGELKERVAMAELKAHEEKLNVFQDDSRLTQLKEDKEEMQKLLFQKKEELMTMNFQMQEVMAREERMMKKLDECMLEKEEIEEKYENIKSERELEKDEFMEQLKDQTKFLADQEKESKHLIQTMNEACDFEKLNELNDTISTLQSEKDLITNELGEKMEEYVKMEQDLAVLTRNLKESEMQNSTLTKELTKRKEEVEGLEESLASMRSEMDTLENERELYHAYERLLMTQVDAGEVLGVKDGRERFEVVKRAFFDAMNERKFEMSKMDAELDRMKLKLEESEQRKSHEPMTQKKQVSDAVLEEKTREIELLRMKIKTLESEVVSLEETFIVECENYEMKIKQGEAELARVQHEKQHARSPENNVNMELGPFDTVPQLKSQVSHLQRQLDSKKRLLQSSESKTRELQEKLKRVHTASKQDQKLNSQFKHFRKKLMQNVQQFIMTFNSKNGEVKSSIKKYHKNFVEINELAQERVMAKLKDTSSFLKDLEKKLEDGNACYANVEAILKEFCEPGELEVLRSLHPFEKVNRMMGSLGELANVKTQNALDAEWKKQKLIYEAQVSYQLSSLDEAEKKMDDFYKGIGELSNHHESNQHNYLFF